MALLSTWLNLEPSYLTQLCIYTGATYREEIMHLSIIFLKLWIFLKIHILHFLSHLTYMPKILILHLAYHTHTYTDTHRHIQIPFHILHFLAHLVYMPNIFGIPQTYTCTDTQTYVQRHWHTDTDTLRHMLVCKHMHVCIHTQTHTPMCIWGI